MSFYRTILAAIAAAALIAPVFADNSTMTQNPADASMQSSASAEQQGASTEQRVNVNKATAKQLMKIKGLTASKARAIIAYRKKNGEFKSLDDLGNVKGFKKIKPEVMKEIQGQLTVE